MTTQGIHHVTAVASDASGNCDFYTRVLGLRLVKQTVNFDDPTTYHLYYGDDLGRPGTIITFFPWPGARPGTNGAGNVIATAYAVPENSHGFWADRLLTLGVRATLAAKRFDQNVLTLTDPDGLPIELIETPDAASLPYWAEGGVAGDFALRAFHSVTLLERKLESTSGVLIDRLGYKPAGVEADRHRFITAGNHAAIVDVVVNATAPRGQSGAGTVHHVAFRAADDAEQIAMLAEVQRAGLNVSPVMERNYFRSIYFREPGGVLFEVATDAPGFDIDEPRESLGRKLMLPEQYEPHRAQIERALPSLIPSVGVM